MSDAIDKLLGLKERLDALIEAEGVRSEKLAHETADLETRLVLANALAALDRALHYVRHDEPRSQIVGAREQIKKVLAA